MMASKALRGSVYLSILRKHKATCGKGWCSGGNTSDNWSQGGDYGPLRELSVHQVLALHLISSGNNLNRWEGEIK